MKLAESALPSRPELWQVISPWTVAIVSRMSCLIVLIFSISNFRVQSALAQLPSKSKQPNEARLEQELQREILPAAERGDNLAILKALVNVVARLDDTEVNSLDAALRRHGLAPAGELLAASRLQLVVQNLATKVPKPQPRELVYVIPAIHREIDRLMSQSEELPVFQSAIPEPETLEGYDDLFWKLHVHANELTTAFRLAQYGQSMLDTALKQNLSKLTPEAQTAMDVDFESLAYQAQQTQRELAEIKIELRVRRLARAADVLQKSKDFRERLIAAFAAELDSELLTQFFSQNPPGEFERPRLNEPGLADSVNTYNQVIRQSNSSLIEKSRLYFEGLHWWLRGRYGMGTDGYGLLKSPAALQSAATLFPLLMPISTPKPTDPFASTSAQSTPAPDFDRRHHYNWMYEYRKMRVGTQSSTAPDTNTHKIQLSHFY